MNPPMVLTTSRQSQKWIRSSSSGWPWPIERMEKQDASRLDSTYMPPSLVFTPLVKPSQPVPSRTLGSRWCLATAASVPGGPADGQEAADLDLSQQRAEVGQEVGEVPQVAQVFLRHLAITHVRDLFTLRYRRGLPGHIPDTSRITPRAGRLTGAGPAWWPGRTRHGRTASAHETPGQHRSVRWRHDGNQHAGPGRGRSQRQPPRRSGGGGPVRGLRDPQR